MHITTEGQVTIPQHVRDKLDIDPDTEVEFIEEDGRFYLVKIPFSPQKKSSFRRLRGIATVKMSTDEIMTLTRGDE